MSMASNVRNYLDRNGIHYDIAWHPYTLTSMRTAQAAHVSGEELAKGVLLKDTDGFVLAVVPASHYVRIPVLAQQLGRRLRQASEDELADIFTDCDRGAVPALGPAYDLETVVDPALFGKHDIWFEGGDHEELIHVAGADFEELLDDASFVRCSKHRM